MRSSALAGRSVPCSLTPVERTASGAVSSGMACCARSRSAALGGGTSDGPTTGASGSAEAGCWADVWLGWVELDESSITRFLERMSPAGTPTSECPYQSALCLYEPTILKKCSKLRQNRSYPYSTNARKKMQKITTIELRNSSPRVGQETLFISASTAIKKSANDGMLTRR